MSERYVSLKGNPLSPILGEPVQVGQQAPAVAGRTNVFGTATFDIMGDTVGKVRVLNFVPSLNTRICDLQTRRFNSELAADARIAVITISADLPSMQKNWCATAGLPDAIMVSDAFDMAVGTAYGTYIRDVRLDQRAVIVVDAGGVVRHTEYCPDISMEPDYDRALSAVKAALAA